MNRTSLSLLFLIVISSIAFAKDQKQPNILFLFTDDHATQAVGAYGSIINETPQLDRLAKEGMLFKRCYVTNSICAPSRAVVLTGKYSHINGQRTNKDVFDGSQQTVPKLMKQAGYQTAIIGKWHLKSTPTGFDHFEVLRGQGQYYNPTLLTNGKTVQHEGYTTDIITDQTIKWLNARDKEQPFFLMCQHKAPHGRWEPAARHLTLYDDKDIPEPETLFDDFKGRSDAPKQHTMGIAQDMGDHRLMFKYSSKHTPEQKEKLDAYFQPQNAAFKLTSPTSDQRTSWNYQRYIRNYIKCVAAVDENIGRMLDYLDDNDLSDNTVVIYSSDQGFYLGEHGWFDKRWMYAESLRTPLIVRWPGNIKPGSVNETDIVSNLDFAETFLSIAGVTIPEDMQGKSMVPVLEGKTPKDWRKNFYYHYYESGGHGVPIHFGVTDGRYKLIRFPEKHLDCWEFYDLEKDPQELESKFYDPEYANTIKMMKRQLKSLQKQYLVEK